MKLLHKFWPWRVIDELEAKVSRLNVELAREKTDHEYVKTENVALKSEIKSQQDRNILNQQHLRKAAQILALKGGILALLFLCFSALGQPVQRNVVTTNLLGNAINATYFLGWDAIGLKPAWLVPAGGGGTNYWQTNAGFVFPVPLLSALGVSNNLGFFNAGGDVSQNATNHDWVIGANGTNFGLLIGQNATNNDANSTNFALLIGSNATNNDNLHAANNTNFSLLIGANATNNDANSTNFALLIGANATNDNLVVTNGIVAGVRSGTIALTNALSTLSPTSQDTNYTVPLTCNPNVAVIHMANTNAFLTFTGTNVNGYQCTVCFRGFTNAIVTRFTLNLPSWSTNLNLNYFVTNGTCKFVNFYNLDTTGTNVVASDAGTSPHT